MNVSNQGGSTRRDWLVEWVNRNVTLTQAQLLFCDPSKG